LEVDTKFEPVTVNVNAGLPAATLGGDKEERAGVGLFVVKVWALEVPPPGDGLTTVTLIVPPVAMSVAAIAAVSCVLLTKVVVRLDPFHCTVELETKFVPLTVSVNAAPPALAIAGLRLDIDGTGLFTVKVCALELPPPGAGLTTVTLIVPAAAMSAAVIAAVSCVVLTNVVPRLDPFHCTDELEIKFVPLTVSVNASPPTVLEVGLRLVIVGAGLFGIFIVKIKPVENPLWGTGLVTVTSAVPGVEISDAGIEAINFVLLMNVVLREFPFQLTVEPETKFDPSTVRLKAAPPANALGGLSEVREIMLQAAVLIKIDTLLDSPLTTARSGLPSPLKSPIATEGSEPT
jgi:hypothetical protein